MKLKIKKKPFLFVASALLVIILISAYMLYHQKSTAVYKATNMNPQLDIVSNLQKDKDIGDFYSKLQSVGYETFLTEPGPYTIFVPLNDSLDRLPDEAKYDMTVTEPDGNLRAILQYHVVEGRYTTADFKDGMELDTVQGEKIKISKQHGEWVLNNSATIKAADIRTKNGVIHIIDNYLLP
jgi:uncharacterized surface protein with fasciclin (FAS1) repeats